MHMKILNYIQKKFIEENKSKPRREINLYMIIISKWKKHVKN